MKQELWVSIRSKAVSPNRSHFAGDDGPDDLEDWVLVDDAPQITELTPIAGTSCIIVYQKPNGESSERLVTCQRVADHAGVQYLWAYCHSRGAVRQFRVDRVISVCDVDTGEQHPTPQAFFGAFAINEYHGSKPGWGLSVRGKADFVALLNALVFIARCDKKFHSLEREVLEQIVCSFWLRMEHPGEPDCQSIMAHVDRLAPDAETFWVAMHRCANSPPLLALLKNASRRVIEADGHIATEEFYWGSQIDEFARELAKT